MSNESENDPLTRPDWPLRHDDEIPTVVVNEADLMGLRMPGDYEVEFDRDAGTVTITSGPEAGKVIHPADRVIDAMREAQPGETVMDTVDRYQDAAE